MEKAKQIQKFTEKMEEKGLIVMQLDNFSPGKIINILKDNEGKIESILILKKK